MSDDKPAETPAAADEPNEAQKELRQGRKRMRELRDVIRQANQERKTLQTRLQALGAELGLDEKKAAGAERRAKKKAARESKPEA